jgi:polyhydroxybutyrate depolymerase
VAALVRRAPAAALVVLSLLLFAACGGDDGAPDQASAERPTSTTAAPPSARPSPGCDAAPVAPVREEPRTLTVDGAERSYLVTVPEARRGDPLPLVLDIHGLAEGPEIQTKMSGFSDVAEHEGFIVAYPRGTGAPIHWNTFVSDANPDVRYIGALLDAVEAATCVDESRVYATGLSNGAMMTSVLACTLAERLAAVAPVSGVMMPDGCNPELPVPVLTFHGTADPILLFNGGIGDVLGRVLAGDTTTPTTPLPPADLNGAGYPEAVAKWAAHDGCDDRPKDEEVTPELTHRVYRCPDGTAVEFYIVIGGGHTWPSSEFSKGLENIVGPTTDDIDATQEIWRFFQRFQRA